MIYFADEDLPDPRDPLGYLDEDARYLFSGPLPREYESGAGGRERIHPADSALSSLPICEETTDAGACDARLLIVAGTMTRIRCSRGHERPVRDATDALKVAEIRGAFERRGGAL